MKIRRKNKKILNDDILKNKVNLKSTKFGKGEKSKSNVLINYLLEQNIKNFL